MRVGAGTCCVAIETNTIGVYLIQNQCQNWGAGVIQAQTFIGWVGQVSKYKICGILRNKYRHFPQLTAVFLSHETSSACAITGRLAKATSILRSQKCQNHTSHKEISPRVPMSNRQPGPLAIQCPFGILPMNSSPVLARHFCDDGLTRFI